LTINKVEQNNFEEEFVLEVTNDYGKASIHAKAQGTLDAKGTRLF
jgi:hypothetical protein